jgi:hypothetical protein
VFVSLVSALAGGSELLAALGHEVEAAWPAGVAAGTEYHSAGTMRDVQAPVAQGTAAAEVLGWQAGGFWAGHRGLADMPARTHTLILPELHRGGVVVATTQTSPLSLQVHHFAQEGTGKTCWGFDLPRPHGSATIDVVDLVLLVVTAVEVQESCTSRLVVLAVVQQ